MAVFQDCNPSTRENKAGVLQVHASLGHSVRPHLRKTNQQTIKSKLNLEFHIYPSQGQIQTLVCVNRMLASSSSTASGVRVSLLTCHTKAVLTAPHPRVSEQIQTLCQSLWGPWEHMSPVSYGKKKSDRVTVTCLCGVTSHDL